MKSYCCFFLFLVSVVPAGWTSFKVVVPLSLAALAARVHIVKSTTAVHLRIAQPPQSDPPLYMSRDTPLDAHPLDRWPGNRYRKHNTGAIARRALAPV